MNGTELFLRGVQYACLLIAGLLGVFTVWALYLWTTGIPTLLAAVSTGAGALLFAFVGWLIWLTGRHESYGGSRTTEALWKGW